MCEWETYHEAWLVNESEKQCNIDKSTLLNGVCKNDGTKLHGTKMVKHDDFENKKRAKFVLICIVKICYTYLYDRFAFFNMQ